MAVTQADIDALNDQIKAAEKQVAMGGQQITYRSISELVTARNDLQKQLDAAAVAAGEKTKRPKQVYAYHAGRGY